RQAGKAEWKRLGPNVEANLDAIAALRRALYVSDAIDYKRLAELDRQIKENLTLPPDQFNAKVVPLLQRELKKKR
ncbi:MAG: hypothetical protein Q7R47_03890, partial [Candidatus Diapherotrites archaeon]|nr:hypothetical protein [Candidatus Diapherotrites archaeon]